MAIDLHKNATGPDLHVPGYVQTSDPGAVGAGMLWLKPIGASPYTKFEKYVRNGDNTAWLEEAWDSVTGTPTTLVGYGITDALQAMSVNAQTGTTYTLVLGDANNYVRCTNAGAITLTVPPNSAVAFPVGTAVRVEQGGAGAVTITPGVGVTVSGTPLATTAQYQALTLTKIATDTWVVAGSGGDPAMGGDLTGTASNAQLAAGAVGVTELATSPKTFAVVFEFGDELTVPTVNTRAGGARFPVACTITRADIAGDASGSAVVDVLKAGVPAGGAAPTYTTIAAAAKPTLSSAGSAADTTLTGWTTSVAAGERLKANLDSVTTCKKITVTLTCVRS